MELATGRASSINSVVDHNGDSVASALTRVNTSATHQQESSYIQTRVRLSKM